MAKIGIFSGSFDPVHAGHVAFAEAALARANLDRIYFAPEIQPRRKGAITHIAHRLAMLRLALEDYSGLSVLEMPDKNFSVAKTLPRLKKRFAHDQLYFVCGSDMLEHMPQWLLVEQLLNDFGLVVGVRGNVGDSYMTELLGVLPKTPKDVCIVKSPESTLSSSAIRNQIENNQKPQGIDPNVQTYIDKNWLYHMVPR